MASLRAERIEMVPSSEGIQADILLIEPNGDSYRVRCLCKPDGTTELGGEFAFVDYLNEKYGAPNVCGVSRRTTMA